MGSLPVTAEKTLGGFPTRSGVDRGAMVGVGGLLGPAVSHHRKRGIDVAAGRLGTLGLLGFLQLGDLALFGLELDQLAVDGGDLGRQWRFGSSPARIRS